MKLEIIYNLTWILLCSVVVCWNDGFVSVLILVMAFACCVMAALRKGEMLNGGQNNQPSRYNNRLFILLHYGYLLIIFRL